MFYIIGLINFSCLVHMDTVQDLRIDAEHP